MKNAYIVWVPAFLCVLWLSGLHVNDVARALLFILVIAFLWQRQKLLALPLQLTSGVIICFVTFLSLFAVFLFTEPYLSVFAGSHGIDFAIFTQVVDSLNRYGSPMTSLVSLEKTNFLTHHFVPFFHVPAVLTSLGWPAYTSLSLVHALCGTTAGLGFYLTARRLQFTPALSLLLTTLLFANPTVRHGLFYGVHDEVFSLPFLMFAFWGWVTRRYGLTAVLLVLAATTKESLSAVGLAMIGMIMWDERTENSKQKWSLLAAGLVLLSVFVGYFFLQPLFLGKHFDHISKLSSLDELLNPRSLMEKLGFAVFLLLPLALFPFWAWKQWHLFLPACPLLGIIFISRFPDMWSPLNYYGVVPTFLLYAGSLVALARSLPFKDYLQRQWVVALLFCLAFAWSSKKPLKTIVNVVRLPTYSADQLQFIPPESSVIASPAAALFLLGNQDIWRLGNATATKPELFDFVVRKVNDLEELDPGLAQKVELCSSDNLWQIYCSKTSRFQLRAPKAP